ncbi:hypothetical protein [Kitasatospora atroaurantiaca]|uniref:Uncharacterized protein n=1 Tax=Kitasatospora atroaurantiaca TaxID=285545 RepID=A0A561ENB0_9ACTN|nr:hypothetical protein [Kitasatospora atroaurantiaca]TWE17059.1 hypothetical protein FB465_2063 [Kitasatospora atroaurantiaca]
MSGSLGPVTVQIRTKLPVSVRDLPALHVIAERTAKANGVSLSSITMAQDGDDLVLAFEVTPS